MRHRRHRVATALSTGLLIWACGNDAQSRATPVVGVSPAHCMATLDGNGSDPLRCPAPLRTALREAATTCRDAGGTLVGAEAGTVWSLDVDGDERQELLFELDGNVACEGAWSVFSCGSRGCPKTLYGLRGREWAPIGEIFSRAPELITIEDGEGGGYRALEVCNDVTCGERWTYEWRDERYEQIVIDVRGTRVEFESSAHGLYPLAAATVVRAAPMASAEELGRYDAGTTVAIVGTAGAEGYYYVSPCNACASGFVPLDALAVP